MSALAESSPWQEHLEFKYATFGRRDPDCYWCGEPVVMALQGFFGGGTWTTERNDEGPLGTGGPPGTTCSASPEGEHDVLNRKAGK